jgi:fructoselysine 6-kinase
MKLIAVGDNVVDCYMDQHTYYPGGNAVNVAVNCVRDGAERVAYLGVFGDDPAAEHIKVCLSAEGVNWEGSRKTYAISGRPRVGIGPSGDRVFLGGSAATAQNLFRIRLTQADLDYIAGFDCCHTSCYSGIEPELAHLAACCPVSFDFATSHADDYIARVAPFLRFAFFSGASLPSDRQDRIIQSCHGAGVEGVGITLGPSGALLSWRGERFRQAAKPVPAMVDTMGAGDSFIAGFLTRFHQSGNLPQALDYAAERAALTCGFHGAFGYPHPFDD